MRRTWLTLAILFPVIVCWGQDETPTYTASNFGIGFGIDYGGYGGRVTVVASPGFAIMGAVGYNIIGVGYNVGPVFRLSPKTKACPTLGIMYGYNAFVKVDGAPQFDMTSYGVSFSGGVELHSRRKPKNFWNIELIVPIRSQEFLDHYNSLQNNASIVFKNTLPPIAFSFGYHFAF